MQLDLPCVDLAGQVQHLLKQIPAGRVTTYGELARALGDEKTRAARWLGEYLCHHSHLPGCNCHRVVRSTGEVGLHISGVPQTKVRLLRKEGVTVSQTGVVDLSACFRDFTSTRPLELLRNFQKSLGQQVIEAPLPFPPRAFAGVDVAYRQDGTACGAYVLLDARTLYVLDEITLTMPVSFPYIPGYLTYRELPVMLELCQQARAAGKLGDVIFCDGNGRLHPWRAGIATCLGIALDHPVLGVGKSLLCGKVRPEGADPAAVPVCDGDEVLATAIRVSENSKPVYLSVGNRLTLEDVTRIGRSAFAKHRVPEPIYHADRLTKRSKNWL
ncbi:endonuclease V [Planctomicrobium sp. SH661]|uniref:endonuclease V n=1 Tax=Planctomicrobium sp. SH661 TaxID=3448124 RepID=UPI003F5CA400